MLSKEACEPCRIGAPALTEKERNELVQQLVDWQLRVDDGVPKLKKTYSFSDFTGALAFTNQVGRLAEQFDHHPLIITEWGKVTVEWWTHKIKGLHRNDFVMAARTDEVA